MRLHVLTLFPEMIAQGLAPSIIGRALEQGKLCLNVVNIRDYTADKHGKVDDYPYGGGAGMLMQAQPVYDAHRAVTGNRAVRTIYVTPQGIPFTQRLAEEYAQEEELVFLCGHYEGIDERVLDEVVTDRVSIGDYVLTGGELPAMVMIDAIARLLPGVLGNESSAEEESFYNDLLEYPQYSRPHTWMGRSVPEVLLSGDHKKITEWRLKQAEQRTKQVRPELYAKYDAKQQLIKRLLRDKRNQIHVIECLRHGAGEILCDNGRNVLVFHRYSGVCMLSAENQAEGERLIDMLPAQAREFTLSQDFLLDYAQEKGWRLNLACSQYVYTQRETLPVRGKVRPLTLADCDYVCSHYEYAERDYIEERIRAGAMFGAVGQDGKQGQEQLAGFIGIHAEGSMGLLYVDEAYRRRGIAGTLEAFLINRLLERGFVPYVNIVEGNEPSELLQEKLGLYRASNRVYWLERE